MKKVRDRSTLLHVRLLCCFLSISASRLAEAVTTGANGTVANTGRTPLRADAHAEDSELTVTFAVAVDLARKHNARESLFAFGALWQKHPGVPEIANNLGVLYARTGDYAKARNLLMRARQLRADYTLADRNLDQVNTALAALTYNEALNDPQGHPLQHLTNGLELAMTIAPGMNRPKPISGAAMDLDRRVAQMRVEAQRRSRQHNAPAPAPSAMEDSVASARVKSVDDWLNDGYAALNRKDKGAALSAFEQAARVSPDKVEAWKNVGYADLDAGHKMQSLKAFQRASQLAPADAEIWKNIGYLQIDQGDKTAALHAFTQAAKYKSDDAEIWTNLAYLQAGNGNKREALSDFLAAQRLEPGNNDVNMEIAYLQSALGNPRAARQQFQAVQKSSHDATMLQQACSGGHDAAVASTRLLSSPNFGDIYFAPSYENTRYTDGLFPFKARLGRHFGQNDRGSAYGFLSAQDDTGSSSGLQPAILNDNAVIAGGGVDYRPIESWPITVYAEAGYGYDLTERNRSRSRYSAEVGITGYQAWGLPGFDCATQTRWPWRPFLDLYGDIEYATRQENDVLLQLRPRLGVTAAQGNWGSAQLYLKLNVLADSKRLYYNNLAELGPGVSWQSSTTIPLVLRVEYVWGRYTTNANLSPTGPSYHGARAEMDFYWGF